MGASYVYEGLIYWYYLEIIRVSGNNDFFCRYIYVVVNRTQSNDPAERICLHVTNKKE